VSCQSPAFLFFVFLSTAKPKHGNDRVERCSIYIVDFDVDDGPVIVNVYPPLMLSDGEAENMYVRYSYSSLTNSRSSITGIC
jgi:hypothetical protein